MRHTGVVDDVRVSDGVSRAVVQSAVGLTVRGGRLVALVLCALAGPAQAECSEEDLLLSRDLASQAVASDNDTIRLLLLKRSADTCSAFSNWLALGELQMELDKPFDAVYAFEHAVDFQPNTRNGLTPDQLLRRAIANARLGEAYHATGELVMALVATQEAVDAFDQLALVAPRRLVHLQAKLDDAVSRADAEVMARTLEIQQDRANRGAGTPARLREAVESRGIVAETLQLLSEFSGDPPITVEDSGIEHVEEGEQAELIETGDASADSKSVVITPPDSARKSSEARLNIPVLFEYNSAALSEQSLATIAELAEALSSLALDEQDSVMVVGHTDARGSAAYNMKLSRERAEVVAAELNARMQADSDSGFSLQYQGRGESELRYSGDDDEDHRRNRRVELIVRKR